MAVGRLVPRYALWLYLKDKGWDPDRLTREAVITFGGEHLALFLAGQRLSLGPRAARRLARRLARFDPRHTTPEEVLERLYTAP